MQYFMTSSPFLRRPTASASTPTIRWITSVSCFTPCGARPRWKIWERRAVPSIASITSSRSDASWWMSSRSSGVMKVRSSRFTTSCVTWSASCSRRLIASTCAIRRSGGASNSSRRCCAASVLRVATSTNKSKNSSSRGRRRTAVLACWGCLAPENIAAVAVAFARFTSVFWPGLSPDVFFGFTMHFPQPIGDIAVGLSPQRILAVLSVGLLTWINVRGVRTAALIQTSLTAIKTGALALLILLGITIGRNAEALAANFGANFWATGGAAVGLGTIGAAMVGSLFSMDAWNNVGFAGSELKNAQRDLPVAMGVGVLIVTVLYVLANVAYLNVLPAPAIASAPQDRVGTAALHAILGEPGLKVMAAAIMISTFGCNNGLILSGARVYYAMARDDLFFQSAGVLHPEYKTPAVALVVQAIWTSLLCLSGTYTQLLNFVIFAALVFYGLTAVGLFALRAKRPAADRPVRAPGYPWLPALYVIATAVIAVDLLVQDATRTYSFLGLGLVLIGVPVYFGWRAMVRRRTGTT